MVRVRLGHLALAIVIAAAWLVPVGIAVVPVARAAAVGWPTSTLVVSEVQTGGASASDEFVEIANQGAVPVDLAGLEVVYATSSGSTVTRKATWSVSTVLDPGRRILLANAAGAYAALADATYAGGFAATGGTIALRVVGGAVIDAVGWGDATNEFVEGSPAPAPAAGSSLERAPGGVLGNGWDTNDGSVDWFVQATPSPQGLAAPPVPAVAPTPIPDAEPDPHAEPDAHAHPDRRTDAGPDADPHPDAGRDADSHPDADADRRRPDARPDANAGLHADADAHADAGPDAHPYADTDSNPDTHADPGNDGRDGASAPRRDDRHGPGDGHRRSRPPRHARARRRRGRDRWHRGAAAVRCRRAGTGHAPAGHRCHCRAVWPARAATRRRRRGRRRDRHAP